jgi:S-(hydroxymethyl)glutathione dehydrogenase/alcohol dehydrogenase
MSPVAQRTMQAAILVQQRAPLVVAEVEQPELSVGQVLVRVCASGVCGKQVDELTGRQGPDAYLPHLLGHEGAGVVEEVGPGVTKVTPGQTVILHWMKGSGIDAAPPRFVWNGRTVSAGWVTTFSERTIASENRVTPVELDGAGFDIASLLGCAVTTGLGIVFNNAELKPGQSIVVFGAGGVGLNVLQGARLVSADLIVAVDRPGHKLTQAKAFGATHALDATQEDLEQALRALSGGRGFDAAVDTTGDARIRELCYRLTSHTGRTIFSGVPHHEERITIDSFPIHFGRRILGVHGGDTKPDTDIPRYLRLYQRGQLKLKEQITHRYRLEQVNDAMACVQAGRAGRCVLEMS